MLQGIEISLLGMHSWIIHSRYFISYCLKQVGRGKEDTPELDKNPGISDPGGLTLDHFKPVVLNMFQKLLSLSCVVK